MAVEVVDEPLCTLHHVGLADHLEGDAGCFLAEVVQRSGQVVVVLQLWEALLAPHAEEADVELPREFLVTLFKHSVENLRVDADRVQEGPVHVEDDVRHRTKADIALLGFRLGPRRLTGSVALVVPAAGVAVVTAVVDAVALPQGLQNGQHIDDAGPRYVILIVGWMAATQGRYFHDPDENDSGTRHEGRPP